MLFKSFSRFSSSVAALALSASALAQTQGTTLAEVPTGASYGTFGIDLSAADKSVKPGDDFWTYTNGNWNKRTAIALDQTSAGGLGMLSDRAEQQVHAILEDAARDPFAVGPGAAQFGDFYASLMDEAAIERAGIEPLKPYFSRIDAATDKQKLQVLFSSVVFASPVEISQSPDYADPTRYTVTVYQGSLGMGGRDYYLEQGLKYDKFRAAYRAYVDKMLSLSGVVDAPAKADRIIALETAMANLQWSPVQSRDQRSMLKPMDAAGRQALAPGFNWPLLLSTAGYGQASTVYMKQSTALTGLGQLFATTPVSTWQDWLKFRLASANARVLPKAFDQANFDFYDMALAGQQQQGERWKRAMELIDSAMGEAVGAVYVKRYYSPESDAIIGKLIANLRAAYKDRITANTWMDGKTKVQALAKLAAFDPQIGHPVKYIDYTSLKVVRDDPFGNVMRATEFAHQLELSRFRSPVDRTLWAMTPQTVNSYYDRITNQITFSAAFLQPPNFDPKADAAVNYGAIGAWIGHEMGHGFDDEGNEFSASGKFENWWTPEARAAFIQRTSALSKQYDAYEPIPGMHVKGALTLGENIGDLGGIETAYAAYQKFQAESGKAPVIGGLTGDQRFFLAYAQAKRTKRREDETRRQLLTDPHSPPLYRVNGVVRNVDAWYTAFNVKPGDAMYLAPAQRVHIW
jgi:putative endopeptidase